MKIATAFSGGLAAVEFALRYEDLKHEIVFACEWDKFARQQYLEFHKAPGVFYNDISDLKADKYKNQIDLFVWGSPCQDLSLAGKRKGFNGEKSSLFREGARVQKEMMPKVFIFENVKGLLSSNKGADYREVCNTFREQGYYIVTLQMNTKDYGIPQNRERIFIVGFLDEEQYHNYREPKPFKLELKLKDMLEDDVDGKYFLSEKQITALLNPKYESMGIDRVNELDDICNCLTTMGGGNREPKVKLVGNCNPSGNGINGNVYSDEGISPTLTTNKGEGIKIKSATKKGYEIATENDSINFTHPDSKIRRGRVGRSVAQTLDCACSQGVIIGAIRGKNPDNPKSRKSGLPTEQMLELNNNGTSNCLTSVQKDNVVLEKTNIRKLTPKECFRLQGVKDEDINLVVSDTQAYKIAGNAISVNVMQELLKSLYKQEKTYDNLFDFGGF